MSCKSCLLLRRNRDCCTSWLRARGCRARLSSPSILRNGCSSACAAVGRCPGWIVSSDETRAFAWSLTAHEVAGTKAQSPMESFFRRLSAFSASMGHCPLRRAKLMVPTAQMSQPGSILRVRGLSDPPTCSGAAQRLSGMGTRPGVREYLPARPKSISLRRNSCPVGLVEARTLRGCTSWCTKPAACRCWRPRSNCRKSCAMSHSLKVWRELVTAVSKSLPGALSMIIQIIRGSSTTPATRTRFGWSSARKTSSSRSNRSRSQRRLGTARRARGSPEARYAARRTVPNVLVPNCQLSGARSRLWLFATLPWEWLPVAPPHRDGST
mmetsp:Transcript_89870/g.262673  ORF Transcript_89870/g.262673 Transcript_89870/m.262673 type:complete len:325 (+) Transcript_89870:607-1581(+)